MPIAPNLADYTLFSSTFSWEQEKSGLSGLPDGQGINIAYEAIDRHATGPLRDHTAFRFIKKDNSVMDCTYQDFRELSNRFANVLHALGMAKGDRVFVS